MRNFTDKVVVITGAGSGIGRALALNFAAKGARLALNDFKADLLAETIALVRGVDEAYARPDRLFESVFDVAEKEASRNFAAEVFGHFGAVDVVICNAGVAMARLRVEEISLEEFDYVMGINFRGVLYGNQFFLPYLRKSPEASLINISSVFGLHGVPGQSPYVTSKFAVRGLTESLAMEERIHNTNVHVACVHPGGIRTNIARFAIKAEQDQKAIKNFEKTFINTPEKAARVIINGIKRRKRRILVGPDAHLIMFTSRYAQWALRRLFGSYYRKM